jgi:hypothetical protein
MISVGTSKGALKAAGQLLYFQLILKTFGPPDFYTTARVRARSGY